MGIEALRVLSDNGTYKDPDDNTIANYIIEDIDIRRIAIVLIHLFKEDKLNEVFLVNFFGRSWTPLQMFEEIYACRRIGVLLAHCLINNVIFREETGFVLGKKLWEPEKPKA